MRTLFIRHRASRSYQCLCHLKKRYFLDNIQSRSSTLYYSLLYRVWRTKSSGYYDAAGQTTSAVDAESSKRRIRRRRRQYSRDESINGRDATSGRHNGQRIRRCIGRQHHNDDWYVRRNCINTYISGSCCANSNSSRN